MHRPNHMISNAFSLDVLATEPPLANTFGKHLANIPAPLAPAARQD
jgi:hypothetical protein